MNVYNHDDSIDSANSSGESSRRNSINPFNDFKQFVRRRRNNNSSKMNNQQQQQAAASANGSRIRKVSIDSQFFEGDGSDEEKDRRMTALQKRRSSVPEKFMFKKDYAILRQSRERQLEIVAAFNRHTDPYKEYMQSLLCYDLAPKHGTVLLIDCDFPIRKLLSTLNQTGHRAALVINSNSNTSIGMITYTDCLRAIIVGLSTDSEVGNRTVQDFIKIYGRKCLVSAHVNMSVWNAARLFCLNHIHRIPIFQVDDNGRNTDLLFVLSLRKIFDATVLKLIDLNFSLAPHIKQRTLDEARIGTWSNVFTVPRNTVCRDIINCFMLGKISCIAVVDENNKILGKVSKSDIIREVLERSSNILDVMCINVQEIYRKPPYANATNTIYETVMLLLASDDQCIFVIDENEEVIAAIAFIDIMDYILNSSDVHQKMNIG